MRKRKIPPADLKRALMEIFGMDGAEADSRVREWKEGESLRAGAYKREIAEQKKLECAEFGKRAGHALKATVRRESSAAAS